MTALDSNVPYGYCKCGCGKKAPVYAASYARLGHVKGEPCHFLRGHANTVRPEERQARTAAYKKQWAELTDIPYGYCWCGCMQKTKLAPHDDATAGYIKGEPRRHVKNHDKVLGNTDYKINRETGCWEWQRSISDSGYGRISRNQHNTRQAHRYYYIQYIGPVAKDLVVHHRCENRRCVNPNHLEATTVVRNARLGRTAKAGTDKVRRIRELYATGLVSYTELARLFDLNANTIGHIVRERTWKP